MASDSWCFLHAADLHIDSPLRGLVAYEGAPAEQLRLATREAFLVLIELAIEREVRFVILAGDLFDGEWRDAESPLWFLRRLRGLIDRGIEVFVVRGNHDAGTSTTAKLRWPQGAHVFGAKRPESIAVEELDAVLHGQSYADQKTTENLAQGYPDAHPGKLNIGVLHTALEGRDGHDPYAPCTAADLAAKGYDYWALGHVHTREVVSEDPWIVFPGNLQGRHVRETGAKGASIVRVQGGAIAAVEHVDCDVARWAVVAVDAAGATDEDELLGRVEEQLRATVDESDGRLVAARVVFSGATALDGRLRRDQVRWIQDVRATAAEVSGELWLEEIQLHTQPLATGRAVQSGLVGLGQRVAQAELEDEDLAALTRRMAKLAGRLPKELREAFNPGDGETLRAAFDPARRYLAALLAEGDGEDGE